MHTAQLDAVLAIETVAYALPWTRGNFIDSLASGYLAQCLFDAQRHLLGYCIALPGAGEMHLLNLTVAPSEQGRGHARHMLDALVGACGPAGLTQLWLEVRAGNARARALYRRYGFVDAGLRRAYYPATPGQSASGREDAVVMTLRLSEEPP
jgi:ribosomal-protein-alanine N-acetyltransferase